MSEEIEDLPEMSELEPLEELPPETESGEAPAREKRLTREEKAALAAAQIGQKRELEQAPQILRKASMILLIGSLFPWLVALKVDGQIPWAHLMGAKAVALLAGYVFLEGYKATHGGKSEGFIAKLARAHHVLVPALAGVIAIAAFAIVFMAPDTKGFLGAALGEVATLMLASATLSHIFGYEHGGKFNPIFPLMFLGPGIAGLLSTFGGAAKMAAEDSNKQIVGLGIVGNLVVAAGGLMAIWTMIQAMKQAKVEGDRKTAERREARKSQRSSAKRAR